MLHFNRISVVGAGLIGGSILLAAKKQGLSKFFSGWSHSKKSSAFWSGFSWVQMHATMESSVQDADLVILATPVDKMGEVFLKILPHLKPGALITDVGSVKKSVLITSLVLPPAVTFIGSHPMAGSEKAGPDQALATLFENRFCFITPSGNEDASLVKKLELFWQALGAKTFCCRAEKHDEIVAAISHVPHASAAALMLAVKNLSGFDPQAVGAGLKDSTRIAAGEENLWVGILLANATHVSVGLKEVENQIILLRQAIENGDSLRVLEILKAARLARQSLDEK